MSAPKSLNETSLEDLSARARRGNLSVDEQRVLDLACGANPALRLSHDVGRAFDEISGVRAGDEAIVARLADRVLMPLAPKALRSVRAAGATKRLAWVLGMAGLLVSSGAAAWWTGVVQSRAAASPVGRAPSNEPVRVQPPLASRAGPTRGENSGAPSVLSVEAAGPEPVKENPSFGEDRPSPGHPVHAERRPSALGPSHERTVAPAWEAPASNAETSADVFRKANAARRSGDVSAAVALYHALQTRFAGSDEARLSRLSLGKLLLSSGRASEAERQFSLYLSEGGRELAEEALSGSAESFAHLGRPADEQRSWERLVRDFPVSIYAARAQQRLADLRTRER